MSTPDRMSGEFELRSLLIQEKRFRPNTFTSILPRVWAARAQSAMSVFLVFQENKSSFVMGSCAAHEFQTVSNWLNACLVACVTCSYTSVQNLHKRFQRCTCWNIPDGSAMTLSFAAIVPKWGSMKGRMLR